MLETILNCSKYYGERTDRIPPEERMLQCEN